jgi:hypothetical protein
MNRINQESLAGRFQSFDTELPEQVRAEFFAPRRPRILARAKPATLKQLPKWPLYLALLIAALLIGGTASNLWRQREAERTKTTQAISQPLAPQPTPAPGPSVTTWREFIAQHPEQFPYAKPAPRAVLVKLPPPKAELIRLPDWKVGETRPVMMPYNLQVLATFRGQLPSIDMLPSSGNQIGDMWVIGDTAWLWLVAPGTAVPSWVDP